MTNRKRKCKYCDELIIKNNGIVIGLSFYCNYDHHRRCENEKREAKLSKIKTAIKKTTIKKVKKKGKSHYTEQAQKAVNAYVRARDHFNTCISCGKESTLDGNSREAGGIFDAGHFISVGSNKGLRFNLHNIHKQCRTCNSGRLIFSNNGEGVGKKYEENLIQKIGEIKVNNLNLNPYERIYGLECLKRIAKIFTKKAAIQKRRNERAFL